MSNFIEKYIGFIVMIVSVLVLFYFRDKISSNKVDASLTDFLNIFSIFAGFLTTSLSILFSIQDKRFIKIAKTSGAYQDLLRLIYKTIGFCVLSIFFVIFAKLISCYVFKLISLSICFGSLSYVTLSGFLFVQLMLCNSSDS